MLSNILGSMSDAAIYAIIGLVIFMGIFIGVVVWVFRMDRNYLSKMENLPLENDNKVYNNTES